MPRNRYHDTPVVEFHEAFDAPVAWAPTAPEAERRQLRVKLLVEEVLEFAAASGVVLGFFVNGELQTFDENTPLEFLVRKDPQATNLTEAADALADIRYVTDGAALEWGIPLEKCLREVHRSNMSKLPADGVPLRRDDGKILKPPSWTPPDLKSILDLYAGVDNSGGGHGD